MGSRVIKAMLAINMALSVRHCKEWIFNICYRKMASCAAESVLLQAFWTNGRWAVALKSITAFSGGDGQFYPELVCGNEYVSLQKPPRKDITLAKTLLTGYSYIVISNRTIPVKPFFCYLAFGANHPRSSAKAYIDRYKGN